MGFSFWIHGFWFAGLVIQPFLVAILLLRKIWKKFPLFTVFCSYTLLGDTVAFFIVHNQNRDLYIRVYPIYETISILLALAVIYEIFIHLFSSQPALLRLARLAFCAVCVFLILLGIAIVFAGSPIGAKGLVAAVLVVEEASRVLELGLILFLFVFSSAFGLHWRAKIFGIVLGLGISSAVKLVTVTVSPQSYAAAGILSVATLLAYDVGCLIWLCYMLAPERVEIGAELPKRAQLEQWNQAVMELIHQ
jgi:hypothetical protein